MSFNGCLRIFIVVYIVLYLLGFRFRLKTNSYLTLLGMLAVVLSFVWLFTTGTALLDGLFDDLFPGGDTEFWR